MWFVVYPLFTWYLCVLLVGTLGIWGVWKRAFRYGKVLSASERKALQTAVPGVTILRPLKGIDEGLTECLRSSFVQTYPVEVVFCVADAEDPAIQVVKELQKEYPEVDCRILVGNESYGPNPKINNLAKGYAGAKYDVIWALDSNAWAAPNSVEQAVKRFYDSPDVALVHNLPAAVATHSSGYGSQLDEMYLLTSHAKFYTGINEVGIAPCVCGKSNFYRKCKLDAATGSAPGTGIRHFAQYISEDQMIAEALWAKVGKTALLDQPIVQPLGESDLSVYWGRRVRWIRVRKYMVIAATLVEPTTESVLSGLIGAYAGGMIFIGKFSWIWFAIHMLLWCLLDYVFFHCILSFRNLEAEHRPAFTQRYFSSTPTSAGHRRPCVPWIFTWLGRELLSLPIWVIAMGGSKIEWRNRPFRIRPDLTAEEIAQ